MDIELVEGLIQWLHYLPISNGVSDKVSTGKIVLGKKILISIRIE